MATSMAFKDLSGQDLRKSKFTKADLRGVNFSGANLEGVPMFGAICVDAKFVGANLRGTDLESVDLEGADLTNAVMEGALVRRLTIVLLHLLRYMDLKISSPWRPVHMLQLTNAQFKFVKSIEGADFTDALIRKDVMMGLCKLAKGVNPETGVSTAESLNCP